MQGRLEGLEWSFDLSVNLFDFVTHFQGKGRTNNIDPSKQT